MATNKHATIRYNALDHCFNNPGRKYFIEDLIIACNNALYEYNGSAEGIKKRQLYEDIRFMESEQGWSVPLEKITEGRKVFYRYSEKGFSIRNSAINETEVKQLSEALSILTRFKGMPQFEWMEEILIRIESAFKLKGTGAAIVGFDQNAYLKGLHHFSPLFNAIQYKKVIRVMYRSFHKTESTDLLIHPYYLKQYNGRWFLFGMNSGYHTITNLALDRIVEITETQNPYIVNETINFEEYFDDVIGVTMKADQEPVSILLQVSRKLWPYIETKPIHGSQKVKERKEEYVIIALSLQVNYELIAVIFSFGEEIKVIEPEELRVAIKTKAEVLLKNYF